MKVRRAVQQTDHGDRRTGELDEAAVQLWALHRAGTGQTVLVGRREAEVEVRRSAGRMRRVRRVERMDEMDCTCCRAVGVAFVLRGAHYGTSRRKRSKGRAAHVERARILSPAAVMAEVEAVEEAEETGAVEEIDE